MCKITAKEAIRLMKSANMKEILLNRAYFSIRNKAEDGQSCTFRFVSDFSMEDVELAIKELENDGYDVELVNTGLFFKRIKESSKIIIKW